MSRSHEVTEAMPLYSCAQVRAVEQLAIDSAGIPGYELMMRAAQSAWTVLRQRWPDAQRITVLCGTGNNGGDGYVLARLARAAGRDVRVMQLGDATRIQGEALQARKDWLAAGGRVAGLDRESLAQADVLVDALFGTGLTRLLDAGWQSGIDAINATGVPVLALDVPSGLGSDSGFVMGVAVRADCTITFLGRKPGLYTGQGREYAGEVLLSNLDLPEALLAQVAPQATLVTGAMPGVLMQPRSRAAHKGSFGHVLVLGGDHGMAGAVRLAGEAALRCGAGRVSVATRGSHAATISAACPELMCHGVETVTELRALLQRATVLVAGPGLGRSDWSRSLLSAALESRLPAVMDADALNLLATDPASAMHWVLTPHPGEAARLLQLSVADIEQDRFAAAARIQQRYGGVTVLKGAGTIIKAADGLPVVCGGGNPGMAAAGMGDVLSGVIGALLAQGIAALEAAITGVCVHAGAADRAARTGERGMLARDVIAELRGMVNP